MRTKRSSKLLVEPAAAASGDIAFNLIVFFLVCASTQPDAGRRQTIPKADPKAQPEQKSENVEVRLTRYTAAINGDVIPPKDFERAVKLKLAGKKRPEERVVVVKSDADVTYSHWISTTTLIEEAGGTVTLEIKEEQETDLPQ
jgi:biopolymer transport protein ExbD